MCSLSVSYTHLDVYKRQLLKSSFFVSIHIWFQFFSWCCDDQFFRKMAFCQKLFCQIPVSYTHLLSMESGSLKKELLEYFQFSVDTPSASAFCQQRNKLLLEAFQFLSVSYTHLDVYKRQVQTLEAKLISFAVWGIFYLGVLVIEWLIYFIVRRSKH